MPPVPGPHEQPTGDPPPRGAADSADVWRPRQPLDVLSQQLAGIERFHRARHMQSQAQAVAARSREARMDSARRMEVLRREHQAVVDRAHLQLQLSGQLLRTSAPVTAVLAHRNAWLLDRVSTTLSERGLDVVARVDNGADAVGHVVAEQPDLLLVEDLLAMVPGEDVVREVLRFSSRTRITEHADHPDRVKPLLAAGARAVYTRRVPPVDIAAGMHRLLTA